MLDQSDVGAMVRSVMEEESIVFLSSSFSACFYPFISYFRAVDGFIAVGAVAVAVAVVI